MELTLPADQKTHNPFGNGHKGEDYGTATGGEIYAAAPGVVLDVTDWGPTTWNDGWGVRIRIEHAPGVITTYNHIRSGSVQVRKGQTVKRKQLLAHMGSTGKAPNGDHLHFELYINGVRVNPAPYRSKDLPGTVGSGASTGDHKPLTVKLGAKGTPWYRTAADAIRKRNPQGKGRGQILLVGDYPVLDISANGAVQVLSNSMGKVWLHPSVMAKPRKSLKGKTLRLGNSSWFWYVSADAAESMKNPHGKGRKENMLTGDYEVLEDDPKTGSLRVSSAGNRDVRKDGMVWVNDAARKHVK